MAEMKGKSRDEIIAADVKDLHQLGYAQKLFREMGGFSNFAISFSIISILTGAMLLYGYGLKFAGPIMNSVGWPVVTIFTLCIAASMAEVASAYPTAGGLYYWATRLGSVGTGWWTAWFNMVGQITITAGIDIAVAIYGVGLATRMFGLDPAAPIGLFGWTLSSWGFYIFMMVVLMIPQILINSYGIKLTAKLNDFSVYWHIGGVAIIALLLTFFSKYHNSLEFMFSYVPVVNPLDAASGTFADGTTGPALFLGPLVLHSPIFAMIPGLEALYAAGPFLLAFPLAFLQAQWTYTGYDASAHVAEETVLARLNSAWGVFLSVAVSAIVGYVVLMAFTYAIPNGDVAATALDPYPVLYIAYSGLSAFLANVVGIIVFGGMWLCGLATITSMSRMFFAFARDEGMPFSSVFSYIHPKYRTPTKSIFWTSVLAVLLTIYSAAYFVVTSISTITLYVAYGIPIWLNFRNKLRKKGEYTTPEKAPWSLKKWGPFINIVAVIWIVFITILFCLPPNELVMWTMVAFVVILLVYWYGYARKHFTGPKAASEDELRKIEADFAAAAKGAGD
jgi:amino acid transporter